MNTGSKKVKPLFLGPKAENQELYESVIIESIRDNCFLRKNFHSEDRSIIYEKDKLDSEYQKTVAIFKQKMQEFLSELKKGVPTYHPRYIGHMRGDLLLPAVAAYFSNMLYNSNNITGESSPATTKMEFDYIRNLCRMIGYEGFKDVDTKEKIIEVGGETKRFFQSWGHLCSGGSSANLESLWVARNIKYYPLTLKLAIADPNDVKEDEDDKMEVFFMWFNENSDISFFAKKEKIYDLTYHQLFNMSVLDSLSLKDWVIQEAKYYFDLKYAQIVDKKKKEQAETDFIKKIQERIDKYSVVNLGIGGIHSLIEEQINKGKDLKKEKWEKLPIPKLYISKSSHYSWDKAMDIVGIGCNNLIKVEMTNEFSLNMIDLKEKHNIDNDCPILAIIGVLGSSKQGSVDPLDEIVEFRAELESNEKSFYFHIDGAYGGYFPVLLRSNEPIIENWKEGFGAEYKLMDNHKVIQEYLTEGIVGEEEREERVDSNISEKNEDLKEIREQVREKIEKNVEKIFQKLKSVKDANSYTIDPHKMGYVPYPAGGILFKDTRMKEFISYKPTYLNKPDESEEFDVYSMFFGEWTLEGSRPGAAAAGCYMANQLLPFNQTGYGLLIRNTVQMANLFMALIKKFNSDQLNQGYQIFPLFQPETNIVEYVLLNSAKIRKVEYLNILTKKLYAHFSVSSGKAVIPTKKFMVAKESFKVKDIPIKVWEDMTTDCEWEMPKDETEIEKLKNTEIIIISSVFMNPLGIYINDVEKYYYEFFKEMVKYADDEVMPEIVFKQIIEKNNGDRIKVLWIEDEEEVKKTKDLLLYKSILGKYLDIDFCELPKLKQEKRISQDDEIAKAIADQDIKKQYQVIILDLNLLNKIHYEVTDENTKTALIIYNGLDDAQKSKVIFCSKFFPKKEREIMEKFNLEEKDKDRMISKPEKENDVKGFNQLINSIFKVFNKK